MMRELCLIIRLLAFVVVGGGVDGHARSVT